MRRQRKLIIGMTIAVGSFVVASGAPASAAGGNGASVCSFATGPSGLFNIGQNIRSHQPFSGDSNPGLFRGVSPFCRP
jgi:hypothetical protein